MKSKRGGGRGGRERGVIAVASAVVVATGFAIVASSCAHAFVVHPTQHQGLVGNSGISWQPGAAKRSTCSALSGRHHSERLGVTSRRPMGTGMESDLNVDGGGEGGALEVDDSLPMREAERGEDLLQTGGVEARVRSERRWGATLRRTLKHGAASLAAFTLGTTALSGMSAELQGRVGRVIPGAVACARASILKPFHKRTVNEKLASVPAFMVTNLKGSPYLSPSMVPGEQLAVFFTNYADAEDMLREMVQNRLYAREARVLIVSLEKAYTMVKQGPRGTGYANEAGQEEFMTFKFEPDSSSLPKARRLGLQLDRAANSIDIPVFYAQGLEVKKDGCMVKPLFMDPADLVEAWKKLKARNSKLPDKPPVQVFSLPEVIVQMEASDELKEFGFFGSSEVGELILGARMNASGPRIKTRLGRLQPF